MPRLTVELGERAYAIHIGRNLLGQVGSLLRAANPRVQRVLVITDQRVGMLYGHRVQQALATAGLEAAVAAVPPGEEAKAVARAQELWDACLDQRLQRGDAIIALGGGVIGDLAGFVAATYLRGIDFVQVPTTLLAMVDASVGGKVAVNLPRGKNLVGAFHQPRAVVVDLDVMRTLSSREFAAGMAEVIKHGVIRDRDYFEYVEQRHQDIANRELGPLGRVVAGSCQIKAGVVSADEKEGGLRAILNFGHTLGHALEAVTGYGALLHGEAVAVGMVAAARLSALAGVLAEPDLPDRLAAALARWDLPLGFPAGVKAGDLLAAAEYDKKAEGGALRWVLPVRLGEVAVTRDVAAAAVGQVLADLGAS